VFCSNHIRNFIFGHPEAVSDTGLSEITPISLPPI
jgi:hypothetical protein